MGLVFSLNLLLFAPSCQNFSRFNNRWFQAFFDTPNMCLCARIFSQNQYFTFKVIIFNFKLQTKNAQQLKLIFRVLVFIWTLSLWLQKLISPVYIFHECGNTLWKWCFSGDPMPRFRNGEVICKAEKVLRLFLLTSGYAEGKLYICWDNAFRKSFICKHLVFFLNTLFLWKF